MIDGYSFVTFKNEECASLLQPKVKSSTKFRSSVRNILADVQVRSLQGGRLYCSGTDDTLPLVDQTWLQSGKVKAPD